MNNQKQWEGMWERWHYWIQCDSKGMVGEMKGLYFNSFFPSTILLFPRFDLCRPAFWAFFFSCFSAIYCMSFSSLRIHTPRKKARVGVASSSETEVQEIRHKISQHIPVLYFSVFVFPLACTFTNKGIFLFAH